MMTVKVLMDGWHGRTRHYVRLQGEDGATCIVRHDQPFGLWPLVLGDSGQEPAG